MYKVYIIEDDIRVLDDMVDKIPWMDNGFKVCGYSANPFGVLPEVERLKPHAVFFDISSLNEECFAIMKTLKDKDIKCEFVILSFDDSFQSCRKFFLMGGFDYIVKPFRINEVQILLERLSVKLFEQKKIEHPLEAMGINPSFLKMIDYIKENLDQKLTLEKLARQFDLNPNYVCNLFAKHYETTLTRFITGLRMESAAGVMRKEPKPLKEIAADFGFADYHYFCRIFKEYFGVSPTEYRHRKRESVFSP